MFSKLKDFYKNAFEEFIKSKLTIDSEKFNAFIDYLYSTDYFYAPAAKGYHDNYPGGLFNHSVGLYKELARLRNEMNKNWTEEEMIIIAFGHDLCKINLYTPQVDEDGWITYVINPDRIGDTSHGTKSLEMLAELVPDMLNERIAMSVICHMGLWTKDVPEIGQYMLDAQTKDDLVFFTHVADMVSSRKSGGRGIKRVKFNEDGLGLTYEYYE